MRTLRTALATTLLAGSAVPALAQQPLPDSTHAAVDRVFAAWSAVGGPGCTLGVSRNGLLVYEKGYGMANLEHDVPNAPGSIFHVASISKQFTAAAVALLARDGKLSLDDDVRQYLPELPDYGHRITLRHLLTHTSGLRDQWDLLYMARGRFEENRITEDDVLEIVRRQKALNFVPGTEFLYSNTGYTLAGTVVRRVSGRSLREFADERIFRPLGMTRTHFHDDYTMIVKGRAAGYRRGDDGVWHVSLPNFDTYGATSLFTTAGDLLRWDANFLRPAVGDQALLREMTTSATLAGGDTTGYGLGIATELHRGTWLVGHGGADAGYRAYLGRFPDHGLGVAVLCNAAPVNPAALARGVADVLLGDRLAPPAEPLRARATLTAGQLAPLAGVYVHPVSGAPTFLSLRGDTLFLGRTAGPPLVPMGDGRFRVAGGPVELAFQPGGELVHTTHAWPRRAPLTLRRHERAHPSRAELERYAGSFHSEELGATYSVTAADSTLVLQTRWGKEVTVHPAYGDTFAGDLLVTFTRDAQGRVDGMTMGSGRVRGVRFRRTGT